MDQQTWENYEIILIKKNNDPPNWITSLYEESSQIPIF